MTRGRYGIEGAVAALLCLAGALLSGCAAERAVLVAGPGITAEALRAEGLAIVGVTVIEEVEQVRPPLVAALEAVMREARPDLPFRSAGEIRDSLGLPSYRRILSSYQSAGRLTESECRELAGRLRGRARFALLARVDKNAIRLPRARRAYDQRYGQSSGAASDFGSRSASRDTRLRVTLYDLVNAREAWAAIYASSSDNVLPDSVPRLPERLIVPRPGASGALPLEPVPEAPSLARALIEGFRAFAADLPREGSPPTATPR